MMNLNELQTAVIAWANEKGIVGRANADKQFLKLDEESGELSGWIVKNNMPMIIDSIGDSLVTLIILAEDLGLKIELQYTFDTVFEYMKKASTTPISRAKYFVQIKGDLASTYNRMNVVMCIQCVFEIAFTLDLNPAHCLEVAYNVIAKRKGKTINGTFVKEEDLCEQ